MIIYVNPDGEAHTKDQAQRVAIVIDKWIYGSFGERIREAVRVFGELMQPLAEAIRKAMKAAYGAISYFEEMVFQQLEPTYKPINHYQRIYQAKHAGRHAKNQYHNKMKNASRSQQKPFKVFQRKI